MGFFRLPQSSIEAFHRAPEVKMDLQIGKDPTGAYVLVIAGQLMLTIDQVVTAQMESYNRIVTRGEIDHGVSGLTFREEEPSIRSEQSRRMQTWVASLPLSEYIAPAPIDDALAALGFIHLGPLKRLPPRPYRASMVYGHLPLHGICSGDEVFYRYESYPTSIRIDQGNQRVKEPETFASPMSDLPLVPTGLAAVSRYALPSLLPARWRYELRPAAGTRVRYGASVPMYGQSGGGVEVMFPHPFNNVGPIANPVLLPIF
jgi:hypothetical protein